MKKRQFAGIIAAAMAMNSLLAMPISTAAVETITIEAEDAAYPSDAKIATSISGYSGTGYVDITGGEKAITFEVEVAEAGTYGLTVRYATPYDGKPLSITVNGEAIEGKTLEAIDTFTDLNAGKIQLNAGKNTIVLNADWGWMVFDSITIGEYVPQARPAITASHKALSDPNATKEAQQVFTYLHSVYGEHILSGQQEIYKYGPHDIETEFNYIKDKTGKLPAIRGFDYGNFCCPAFGSDDGSTERVIAWAEQGGLCTASFHLNVPNDFASYTIGSQIAWDQTTYSEKTDFSPSKAATEGTKENQYYTQALDTLCTEFAKLQDKGITVLWRPLHEAEGNGGENNSWFWWGKEGSKAYRQLYQYTYKYMTETKGLHNLIWEWNSYDYSTSANWYPGDEYVDIIGYDKYNCTDWSSGSPVLVHNVSPIADTFYSIMARYSNTKMVAMMECDSFSTVENLTTEKAGWLYFMPWYDGGTDATNFLSNPMFNTEEDLIAMYQSDYCITLDELPDFGTIEVSDETNEVVNTEATEPEEGHASIADDGKTVKVDFPEASEEVVLVIDMPDGATANGGLGSLAEVDGHYYWVNVQWNADEAGEVTVNIPNQILNVTETVDEEIIEITDEDTLKKVAEVLATNKSFDFQVWSAEGAKTSEVKLTDAYVKSSGTTDPTEPTTKETDPDTTEPTKPSEPPADDSKVTYDFADLEKDADGYIVIPIEDPANLTEVIIDVTATCDSDASWFGGGGGLCFSALEDENGDSFWGYKEFQYSGTGKVTVKFDGTFLKPAADPDDPAEKVTATLNEKTMILQDWWKSSTNDDTGADVSVTYNNVTLVYAAGSTDPTEPTKDTDEPTDEPTETDEPTTPSETGEKPAATKYGDVNGDGGIDIIDVISVNKFLLGISNIDAQGKANADVDQSGELDSTDALNILKVVVELLAETDLPIK